MVAQGRESKLNDVPSKPDSRRDSCDGVLVWGESLGV